MPTTPSELFAIIIVVIFCLIARTRNAVANTSYLGFRISRAAELFPFADTKHDCVTNKRFTFIRASGNILIVFELLNMAPKLWNFDGATKTLPYL